MIIKFVYTLFIGIFLAIFVGVGISAFYEGPKYPDQPSILKYCTSESVNTAAKYKEFETQANAFDKAEKKYMQESQVYNRNVSTIAIIASIIILIASLTMFKKIFLIADGLLLGGVLTLLYSIIRGFGTEDNKFRFLVVSIGFIISLILGYMKFIKTSKGVKK